MALRAPAATVVKVAGKTAVLPTLSAAKAAKNAAFVSGAMMIGDLGCQAMESYQTDFPFVWDHKRTLRMGFTGAFIVTPMSLTWNMTAERIAPGTSMKAILIKMAVSAAALPPMLAAQFSTLTLLDENKSVGDLKLKLTQDFVPTLRNAVWYWPIVGAINSAFVPVLSRPAVSSFAGVFWNVYISYQANNNGLEVGELAVMYPSGEAQPALTGAKSEATLIKATPEGESSEEEGRKGVAAPAVAPAEGATTPATVGVVVPPGKAGQAAEAARKKRGGKFVRRTSVVSM